MNKLITAIAAGSLMLTGASPALAQAPYVSAHGASSMSDVEYADEIISPNALCSGSRIVYKTSGVSSVFTQASQSNSSVTGGPGVTLSISTSTTFTVSGSISATTGVSVSAVIASVKKDIGVTISASRSATATNSGSWTVPSSYKIGRLAIGAVKYSGTTTKYLENSSCTLVKQGTSATFKAPQNEWHFQTTKVS